MAWPATGRELRTAPLCTLSGRDHPRRGPVEPHPSEAPVLVGIDGSSASESATAIAVDEASRRNVGLIAVHA